MDEYVIVGDTDKYEGCLVCVCGTSFDKAKEELQRMLNNPTENDQQLTFGYRNLRIEAVPEDDCWWNGFLE